MRHKNFSTTFIALIMAALILAGCGNPLEGLITTDSAPAAGAPTNTPAPTATNAVPSATSAPTIRPTNAPTATSAATSTPTATAMATPVPVSAITIKADASYTLAEITAWPDGSFVENGPNPLNNEIRSSGNKWQDAHNAALLYLERTYIVRVGDIPTWESMAKWITASGGTLIKGDLSKDARQIEEEQIPLMTNVNVTVVAGVQLKPVHIEATYAGAISTDQPFYLKEGGRAYQPDPENNAHLLTNGGTLSQLTYWGNMFNWGRTLWDDSRAIGPDGNPHKALQQQYGMAINSAPAATDAPAATAAAQGNGCLTLAQLSTAPYSNGIDTGAQLTRKGLLYDGDTLAGAVVKVTAEQIAALEKLGWTIQGSNPTSKSAWSPANCRPLTDGR